MALEQVFYTQVYESHSVFKPLQGVWCIDDTASHLPIYRSGLVFVFH